MSDFTQQYEELFGRKLEFDPLDPNAKRTPPAPRLTLPDVAGGKSALGDDSFLKDYDNVMGDLPAPQAPRDEPGYAGALGRSFKAGLYDVGALGLGMAEYGARETALTHESDLVRQVADDVRGWLTEKRQDFTQRGTDLIASLSPEQQAQASRMIFTLDPQQTIFQGNPLDVVQSLGLKLSRMAPPSLTTLIPGAVLFRVATAPAAIAYMGATEAGMSLGGIQNAVAQEIEAMPDDQLVAESPYYAKLIQDGLDPAQAKQRLISEAQGLAPVIGGLTVGAISAVAGRYLEPVFKAGAGMNVVQRFGRGYAAEAPQEAAQGAAEQIAQNIAAQAFDADRSWSQGALQQGLEEGALGGIFGGAVSALGGAPPQPPQAPPLPQQPTAPPPEGFEQVFGTGGENPLALPDQAPYVPLVDQPRADQATLEEGGQQPMFLPEAGVPPQGELDLGVPQPLRSRLNNAPALAGGQQTLPMQRRVRGGFEAVPEAPSAEPVTDLDAQLNDLQDPDSERQGVYLSADNLASLGDVEGLVAGRGVPIPNFDGKGGTLVARDEGAARVLTDMLQRGADLQEVLGYATGAGAGKPADGDTAVQRLDAEGNVLQESLVPAREAQVLQQQWQSRYPQDQVVVTTPDQVIARREQLINQDEVQARTGDLLTGYTPQVRGKGAELARKRREANRKLDDEIAPTVEEALSQEEVGDTIDLEGAAGPSRAAARVVAAAAKKGAAERTQRVGGFYPTKELDFADPDARTRYDKAFSRLVEAELTATEIEREYEGKERPADVVKSYKDAHDARSAARQELSKIRSTAQPRRKSERLIRAAEKVSPGISNQLRVEAAPKAKEEVEDEAPDSDINATRDLAELRPEDVDNIEGDELEDLFRKAVQVQAGKPTRAQYTYERGDNSRGRGPDADEALPEKITAADQIAEGSEPLAIQKKTVVEKAIKPVELADLKNVGGNRWKYTLKAEGESDIVGYAFGKKGEAEAKVNEIIAKRNKRAGASADVVKGQSFRELIDAHQTPSMKRRLIKRMVAQLRRRQFGGKVKAPKITRTAKEVNTTTGARAEATSFFDTSVLTRETLPQDESVEARVKRQERAKAARNDLRSVISEAKQKIVRQRPEFSEETSEVDGNPTRAALDYLYGRMYFRQLMDYGNALVNSANASASALQQIERVTEFLRSGLALDAEQFAAKMSKLAEADLRESILSKPTKGDVGLTKLKAKLANPDTRAETLADFNDQLRQGTARFLRMTNIWRKNDLYNSTVGPLMRKIADSIVRDGWPSFVADGMTLADVEALNWALQHWNTDRQVKRGGKDQGTSRELLYKPMRRYFMDLGFAFDNDGKIVPPKNEEGEFETPVKVLERQFRAMDRVEAEPALATPRTKSVESLYTEFKRGVELRYAAIEREGEAQDAERAAREASAERTARAEGPGRDLQINRIINQFRERVGNPKLTVEGLIRQEQRLIRAFKELGIWKDTPSPVVGKIVHPTTGVTKTVSIAGPRLETKKLTKDAARKLMLNLSQFKLPKTDADIALEVEERAQKKLNAETDMFLKAVGTEKHGDSFLNAAVELRSILNEARGVPVNGHSLLNAILVNTPVDHPYHELALRMVQLKSTDLNVMWSTNKEGFSLASSSLGRTRFRPGGLNYVLLNKQALEALQTQVDTPTASAAMIHVVLHELTHAATQNAVRSDRGVASGFRQMRDIARRYLQQNGMEEVYGLKADDPIEEFVAEAFSNTNFQALLKSIPIEQETLWNRLISWLKNVLNFDVGGAENMLDLVMATADRVFTDTSYKAAGDVALDLENVTDPVARHFIKVGSSFFESGQVRRLMKQGRWAGVRAPLSLMTLPQIRNEFASRLSGLEDYYRAFKRRDARNSELLEQAERLSRQWTKLTEESAATATEFSYIATEATINDVHPDKSIDDAANKHIVEAGQREAHARLRAAFQSLPAAWQEHWRALQKYYAESLVRESKLLTLNALRATLTKGANAPMTSERFEREYPLEKMDSLTTKEALEAEFGKLLEPEMIATIASMRTLPQKRTGPYFPIMRYGNYVVEASRDVETKTFSDLSAARAWRDAKIAEDPTLDIIVRGTEVGGATATVKEKAFLLAESATEAQLKRDELVAEYGEESVSAVTKKLDYGQASTIQSNEALGRILSQLSDNPGAQSAIRQYYLRSLADRSFRKHEIKRKNRRGYDSKLQHRNFTNYAQSASYYTAQLEYGWQMSDAMTKMREDVKASKGEGREGVRKSEVYEQVARRDKMTTDPQVINDLIRKGVSFAQFTMLTSPSYWMVNATQPYLVSFPYMAAKHGMGATIGAMKNAQALIAEPLIKQAIKSKAGLVALWSKTQTEEAFNVLDQVKKRITAQAGDRAPNILKMLDELRRESILDLSWIAELRDIAEGADTGTWQKVLDASRIMSHLTEVNNRIMTAIAAYNLASASGSHEQAVEYAKDVVQSTHFDYSSGAKPLLFRPDGPLGSMAPLVFQFMQWPQHMYAMLISNMVKVFRAKGVERKEAGRIILGLLGTHMLAGGLIGAMLQPIKWAIGLALIGLGDDDKPYTVTNALSGDNYDRWIQESIADIAGPGIAELLARGAPAALGTDLSDRMSLGTLYFMDLRPESMESTLGSLALSVGGPWLTIGENGFRAVQDITAGEPLRGIERVAPKVMRDFLKTYRYAADGVVNNAGDTVLNGDGIPPAELFLQSLGFSSASVSNMYNKQAIIKDTERYGADRSQALVDRFSRAESAEDRREILKQVAEFNRAFPAARITRSRLVKSVAGRAEREASYRRHGANLRGKATAYADEGWFYQ